MIPPESFFSSSFSSSILTLIPSDGTLRVTSLARAGFAIGISLLIGGRLWGFMGFRLRRAPPRPPLRRVTDDLIVPFLASSLIFCAIVHIVCTIVHILWIDKIINRTFVIIQ